MATSEKNLRKKHQRQVNTSKKRQALFISEYVFNKHFDIYQEAAMLYNKINNLHPKKPDLRKSIEFKNWKLVQSGMPKIRPHVPMDPAKQFIHGGISVPEEEIVPSISEKTFQLRIPLFHPRHIGELNDEQITTQTVDEGNNSDDQVFHLTDNQQVIGEGNSQQVVEEASSEGNSQQAVEEASSEGNSQQVVEEVIGEGNSQQVVEEVSSEGNSQQVVEEVSSEGNSQQVVEKRYEVDDIQPSLIESVSEEIVAEILTELRNDADLCNIMRNIESAIDTELSMDSLDIGMEIELDDLLEKELDLLM